MSAPMLRPTGQAAAETELLAQLGLPASASPEDVDQLHQAVSDYLSSCAPGDPWLGSCPGRGARCGVHHPDRPGWTRGLGPQEPGESAAVVPGEPATPPARSGPRPGGHLGGLRGGGPGGRRRCAPRSRASPREDLAALYAMVTPSAHDDMKPDAKQAEARCGPAARRSRRSPRPAPAAGPNIWKRIVAGRRGRHRDRRGRLRRQRDRERPAPRAEPRLPARSPRPPAAPRPSTRPRSRT